MSLIEAVIARNLFALNMALSEDPRAVNNRNKYGWSALHYAFALDYPEMVEALIQARAVITLRSFENDTPIELGIIFKSMNCLSLVKDQLWDNDDYKLLTKYEADGLKVRQTLHGNAKYTEYAKLARKYVRDARDVLSYNSPGPLNEPLRTQRNNAVNQYRNLMHLFKFNLRHPDGSSLFYNYVTEKIRIGNCDSQASMAYLLCKRVFGIRKVEKFEIVRKPNELIDGISDLSPLDDSGDHVALVLGRAEPGNDHYKSWEGVVCDPWANTVYSSNEIESKLMDVISVRSTLGFGLPTIELRRFNPKTHDIVFCDDQDRLRLPALHPLSEAANPLTHYFKSRKEMGKDQKIKTLREIAARSPSTARINQIAAHKAENLSRFGNK